MRLADFSFRALAFFSGVCVLGAVTHNLIIDGPGYSSPRASVYITIAAACAVAAIGIGFSVARDWYGKAFGLIAGIAAFELAGLVFTAERVISDRDQKQRPAFAAEAQIKELDARIFGLRSDLDQAQSSARLMAALEAQASVSRTVAAKAAERGCASNCRALLQAQAQSAESEVAAARQEIAIRQNDLQHRIDKFRSQRDAIVIPAGGSPLAERLGVKPWVIDLFVAALFSIAGNITACILIAIGSHGASRQHVSQQVATKRAYVESSRNDTTGIVNTPENSLNVITPSLDNDANSQVITAKDTSQSSVLTIGHDTHSKIKEAPLPIPSGCIQHFMRTRLQKHKNRKTIVSEALNAYYGWCHDNDLHPLDDDVVLQAMATMARDSKLYVEVQSDDAVIMGVWLKKEAT